MTEKQSPSRYLMIQARSQQRLIVFYFCLSVSVGLSLCVAGDEVHSEQTIWSRPILVIDPKADDKDGEHLIGAIDRLEESHQHQHQHRDQQQDSIIELSNELSLATRDIDNNNNNYGDQDEDEFLLSEPNQSIGSTFLTATQFEDSQPVNNQKRDSPDALKNLLDVVEGQQNNSISGNLSTPISELDQQFLSLFDELWRIKNSSAIALTKLDHLQLNETSPSINNDTNTTTTLQDYQTSTTEAAPIDCNNGRQCNAPANQYPPGKRHTPLKLVGSIKIQNQATQAINLIKRGIQQGSTIGRLPAMNKNNSLAPLSTVIDWLSRLQRGINQLIGSLYNSVASRLTRRPQQLSQETKITTVVVVDETKGSNELNEEFKQTSDISALRSSRDSSASNVRRLIKRQTSVTDEVDQPKGSPDVDSSDDNLKDNNNNNNNEGNNQDANCINLTIDEELRCKSTEKLIEATLNHSFPGTIMSIENNCAHVTFLLATCWPQQLQLLKASIASWNETLLTLTEFPLPLGSNEEHIIINNNDNNKNNDHQQEQQHSDSCGFKETKSNQTIKDRVNWMWLNLCLDRKFRQDYLDNLRCLSLWSQERAQQVCSHEYRRMQAYLVSQTEVIGGQLEQQRQQQSSGEGSTRNKNYMNIRNRVGQQQQHSTSDYLQQQHNLESSNQASNLDNFGGGSSIMDHLSSRGHQLTGNSPVPSRISDARGPLAFGSAGGGGGQGGPPIGAYGNGDMAQVEREVSSKMLCCMFDQFLRCVNRQAIRDCGRSGAQFVVNFMSRIGTDDMKYLCNSESRTTPTGAHRTPLVTTTTTTTITTTTTSSHKPSSPSGSRRVNHHHHHANDKGPFIENNYCTDPRIQNALFGLMGGQHSGESRNKPYVGSGGASGWQSHQLGGRGKSRNQLMNVNHDPTFFGTDVAVDSATWSMGPHSTSSWIQSICIVVLTSSLVLIIM